MVTGLFSFNPIFVFVAFKYPPFVLRVTMQWVCQRKYSESGYFFYSLFKFFDSVVCDTIHHQLLITNEMLERIPAVGADAPKSADAICAWNVRGVGSIRRKDLSQM
jgi:hypothetical protein